MIRLVLNQELKCLTLEQSNKTQVVQDAEQLMDLTKMIRYQCYLEFIQKKIRNETTTFFACDGITCVNCTYNNLMINVGLEGHLFVGINEGKFRKNQDLHNFYIKFD